MPNILIIDDDADHREIISAILSAHNHITQISATGKEIHSTIIKFKPDLILIDVWLAGEDGRKLCREIKNIHKKIAIILLSASTHYLKNYQDHCADDIIEKPFDIHALVKKVNDVLALKAIANLKELEA